MRELRRSRDRRHHSGSTEEIARIPRPHGRNHRRSRPRSRLAANPHRLVDTRRLSRRARRYLGFRGRTNTALANDCIRESGPARRTTDFSVTGGLLPAVSGNETFRGAAVALTLRPACSSVQHGTPPPWHSLTSSDLAEEGDRRQRHRVEVRRLGEGRCASRTGGDNAAREAGEVEITREFRFPPTFNCRVSRRETGQRHRRRRLAIRAGHRCGGKADGGSSCSLARSGDNVRWIPRNVGTDSGRSRTQMGSSSPKLRASPMFTAFDAVRGAALPGRKYRFPINAGADDHGDLLRRSIQIDAFQEKR